MFVAALIGTAFATPCTFPANPFSSTCATGSIADGGTCVVKCNKYYVPTAAPTYTCTTGTLAPTRIACVPDQRFARMFPWKASKCANLQDDTSFATPGQASTSMGTLTLQTTTSTFWGEWLYKPVRTFGRHQPIEIMFDYALVDTPTHAGAGSNGIWMTVSNAAPNIQAATTPSTGTGAILTLELDFDATNTEDTGATSLNADFATPHIAVLYNSEDHADSTQASLATLAAAHTFTWPTTAKTVSVVLKPVQSSDSVLVELWHGGLLIARDTITKTTAPAANGKIVQMIDQPRRLVVGIFGDADSTDNGKITIQNAKFCGAELPTLWHKYFVPATPPRNRLCITVESFGNPDPTLPGVWRPAPCPAGVMLWPLAPAQNSQTM